MMACDGKIHADEIEEIKKISETTPYFGKLDYAGEIDAIVSDITENGVTTIQRLLSTIKESELTPVQELLLLEVLMRIIHADHVKDPNEIMFLRLVRSCLSVHGDLIMERFGSTDLLFDKASRNVDQSMKKEFFSKLRLPELIDLQAAIPLPDILVTSKK